MDEPISKTERAYLRELAKKQAEYAALPVMREREKMWYALNDAQPGARPPFIIETWTFDRDFLPADVFHCTSEQGKNIERQLLSNIRNHELIDDDKVIPDSFSLNWFTEIDEMGVPMKREVIKDSQGVETGYRFLHPIKDLPRDFALLRPAVCRVDRERTLAWQTYLTELFAGILKVELNSGVMTNGSLTQRVIKLMGMEAFFTAMCDCPEAVHELMAFLRDNGLRIMRWAEENQLLRLNNRNQTCCGSSSNFTTRLPAAGYTGSPRLRDLWMQGDSQETVGVSPKMFHEFCFPYYRDLFEPIGLLYFGCCEPAHPLWEDLRRLPHLKKISISPWCDQRFMGEALRNTGIVFSRKPNPNFLSVDERLNEEGWAAHIRETLETTRGVPVEFLVRDVYTVHGNLNNARRAVALGRAQIARFF